MWWRLIKLWSILYVASDMLCCHLDKETTLTTVDNIPLHNPREGSSKCQITGDCVARQAGECISSKHNESEYFLVFATRRYISGSVTLARNQH